MKSQITPGVKATNKALPHLATSIDIFSEGGKSFSEGREMDDFTHLRYYRNELTDRFVHFCGIVDKSKFAKMMMVSIEAELGIVDCEIAASSHGMYMDSKLD